MSAGLQPTETHPFRVRAALRAERTQRYDLRSLFETSRVLSSSLDLDFVVRNLLLTTMSKLLVTRGAVLLHMPAEARYRVAIAKGIQGLGSDTTLVLGSYATCDMLQDDAIPPALAAYGVALVLAVRYQERHIGLVALGPKATRQDFDEAELEFVQSLVHMSAAAIHNSLVVEELRKTNRDLDYRVQQLNTLFDLSKEFNAAPERARLARLFSFALMGQMMISRHVFFLRRDDSSFEVVSSKGIAAPDIAPEFCDSVTELTLADGSAGARDAAATLHRHGLVLALPLKQQNAVQGILCLGPKMKRQPYEANEIEFLYSLGSLAIVSIQNVDLVEERIEKERLKEELRLAREIQQGLLPHTIPAVPGLQIATMAVPSREVGGDYFDVLALNDGRLHVIIADVTGKGMPAALLMSSIHACTHIMLPMRMELDETVSNINRVIYENTPPDKFITAFAAIYDVDTGRLEYVNAGHEPPLLIRADSTIIQLEKGGLLLGILPVLSYERGCVQLEPGDVVVLFTDGVTEAMGQEQEEYTDHRLQSTVQQHHHRSADALLALIQADVEAFTGPVNVLSDDRTMVILKADPRPPGAAADSTPAS